MLEELLTRNPILPIALFAALSLSDFYLTLYGARLYQQFAANKLEFEKGYELNPNFQDVVNDLRMVSPKHLKWVLLVALLIFLFFLILLEIPGFRFPSLFLFVYGAIFLPTLMVNLRHLANIWLFSNAFAAQPSGITGKIKIRQWHSHKQAAYNGFFVEGLYSLAAFLFTDSFLFLGGAFGFMVTAARFSKLSSTGFSAHKNTRPVPQE